MAALFKKLRIEERENDKYGDNINPKKTTRMKNDEKEIFCGRQKKIRRSILNSLGSICKTKLGAGHMPVRLKICN